MQHGDVWRALDEIATRTGLTPSGLAKLAGLDATAFNKSKRISKGGRPRWPSTESIARALKAANVEYTEFASLVAGATSPTIPFLELPEANRSGLFSAQGIPEGSAWDAIEFPGASALDGCFALEITDTALEPIYRAGDRLIASCQVSIRPRDRVLVKRASNQVCVASVTRQTAQRLDLNSIVDGQALPGIDMDEIDWMARIIWVSQ